MELKVLSPTAILGYGYPLESLERGLKEDPDVIAVDAGSTDPGPYYLGEGVPFVSDLAVERDLYYILKESVNRGIPVVIGSAGGGGAKPHVDWTLERMREVAKRLGKTLRVGVIYSDIEKDSLLMKLREGLYSRKIDPYSSLSGLNEDVVRESTRIVAQVGVEPFIEALRMDVDIIVGGRSVDVAPFSSLAWLRGFDKGLAIHLAKILECGALAAEPGSGSDGMMGILRQGEFEVYPLNPRRRATVSSVAEHALYERRDPYREYVPGGFVDLSNTSYEEIGDGRVVVKGSRWVPLEKRLVKLEGVRFAGYRFIVIAGARDPGFISRLEELVGEAIRNAKRLLGNQNFKVFFRYYGINGVMGEREPSPTPGHEVGIVFEVVAPSKEEAKSVASLVRSTLLHIGWPGRKTTAGNLAFPFSPSDIYAGRVYEWSIWHLIEERDPLEYAKIRLMEV